MEESVLGGSKYQEFVIGTNLGVSFRSGDHP
jgi:hypothetical protein